MYYYFIQKIPAILFKQMNEYKKQEFTIFARSHTLHCSQLVKKLIGFVFCKKRLLFRVISNYSFISLFQIISQVNCNNFLLYCVYVGSYHDFSFEISVNGKVQILPTGKCDKTNGFVGSLVCYFDNPPATTDTYSTKLQWIKNGNLLSTKVRAVYTYCYTTQCLTRKCYTKESHNLFQDNVLTDIIKVSSNDNYECFGYINEVSGTTTTKEKSVSINVSEICSGLFSKQLCYI